MLERDKFARVLVATASHAAANVVLDRLKPSFGNKEMFRLVSTAKPLNEIPMSMMQYCRISQENLFEIPTATDLHAFKIIVSTCVDSGLLRTIGMPDQHFTHVFIDESAQVTEPEALIPMSLTHSKCCVVLAGDHFQLGPQIRSPFAVANGLGRPLQERLYRRGLVAPRNVQNANVDPDGKEPGRCFTMLVRNYRSHDMLLAVCNKLFYENKLQYLAPEPVKTRFLKWER